jgi:hypothetical protein
MLCFVFTKRLLYGIIKNLNNYPNMILLFPRETHQKNLKIDPFFAEEYLAAKKAGFTCYFINEERIKDTPAFCGMHVRKFEDLTDAIYRGYIIRNSGGFYRGFYNSLLKNNEIALVNDPNQYQNGQWLSESYWHFNQYMIPTVFMGKPTRKMLNLASKQLESKTLFIKDFVKSESGYDKINVQDLDGAITILNGLENQRGDMFEGGFALRPYVELSSIEYRLWVYKGRILNESWEKLPEDLPALLYKKIENFKSDFYTIDLGRYKSTGKLVVIETNDGQVSGLKGLDPYMYYKTLIQNL